MGIVFEVEKHQSFLHLALPPTNTPRSKGSTSDSPSGTGMEMGRVALPVQSLVLEGGDEN